jgi:sulfofructose kinase
VRLRLDLADYHARPYDVVTVGLNSVDLIAVVLEYPARNSKQPLERFERLPGGQMATAAAICSRLGWRARYLGSFGDDDLAMFGRDTLVREGVDVSATWNVPGASSQFAVVIVDAGSGDRTVLWHRHPGLRMAPEHVDPAVVTSGRVVLVDCHETAAALTAVRHARQAGIPTVIDVERVRPQVPELLRHVDVILAAEHFPSELTGCRDQGRALAAMAREYDAALVAVTLGDQGSLAWCNGREIRTPAFPVSCVDTTGAGDAFHGGFVAGWLRHPAADVEQLMAYANAVAALNCRGLGARGAMPTPDEVDALLATRSV